jgi:hypothetical protein
MAYEGADQEWNPGVTFHAPKSVGECEGMNLHIHKWTLTLGVGVPMDSQVFWTNFRGQNPMDWWIPYNIGKFLERRCLKWLTWLIWVLKTQVMAKRKVGSQIDNLTPNH